ncbi:hypothetical protein ACLPJK_26280 [Pseudomonas aeruginosa]|uniref:hypothetical protein n=1 Tax=Pseudomonas aeruginosa TaxID=287 RepID=UPI003D27A1B5
MPYKEPADRPCEALILVKRPTASLVELLHDIRLGQRFLEDPVATLDLILLIKRALFDDQGNCNIDQMCVLDKAAYETSFEGDILVIELSSAVQIRYHHEKEKVNFVYKV